VRTFSEASRAFVVRAARGLAGGSRELLNQYS
jgi:hypothetical protein